MAEPPNCYTGEMPVHAKFCYLWVNYRKGGRCEKYQVSVGHIHTCDSWERNWDASEYP